MGSCTMGTFGKLPNDIGGVPDALASKKSGSQSN